MYQLGAVIKRRRKKLGLTQQELASALSIPLAQVQRIEQGQSKTIAPMLLRKIAIYLEIDGNELLSLPAKAPPEEPYEALPPSAKAHLINFLDEISAFFKNK